MLSARSRVLLSESGQHSARQLSARQLSARQLSARDNQQLLVQEGGFSPAHIAEDPVDVESPLDHVPPPVEPSPHGKAEFEFSGVDIMQFSAPIYYADAREGHLLIDIMRLGSMHGEVRAKWHTEDGSAIAGKRYVQSEGEIIFADGVSNLSIQIDLLPHHTWAATVEFKVHLSEPDANCELGIYLKTCRVKLMDSHMFPSDNYRHLLENLETHKDLTRVWGFVWEYMKLNFQVDGIAWRTIVVLLGDQLENMYLLLTVILNKYLVDVVLNVKDTHTKSELWLPSREQTAILVGALYIFPRGIIHLWEYCKMQLGVAGKSRAFLQTSLFRKFMNYSEASREKSGAITVALLNDCPEVADMYMKLLGISKQICQLIILQWFSLHNSSSTWWALLLMPTMMFTYGHFALQQVDKIALLHVQQTHQVANLVSEVQHNYELIADYFQRPQLNTSFAGEITILNQLIGWEEVRILNYLIFPEYLGPIFTGVWIAYCSRLVIQKKATLGMMLAMMSVFAKVSRDFGKTYSTILEVRKRITLLENLTRFFNMETDVPWMRDVNRKRRALTKRAREKALKTSHFNELKCPVTDTLVLTMRDIVFKYPHQDQIFLKSIKVAVHQSSLVAVFGENGAGRQTILRLLALKLFPKHGVVFIPTHLRVLHVSQEPYILRRSAWENLTFACPDAEPMRVLEIINSLEMAETRKLVEQDLEQPSGKQGCMDEKLHWIDALSDSERMKLHLARAFIMNPEVLVLQRPFRQFTDRQWRNVMNVIKAHIRRRGISLPESSKGRRRPRTVFFSAEVVEQTFDADVVWTIQQDKSVSMSLPSKTDSEVANGIQ